MNTIRNSTNKPGWIVPATIAGGAIVAIAILVAIVTRSYKPLDFTQTGTASWYGPGFEDGKTASGDVYHDYDFTAAHRTLPMGSVVRVKNLDNGMRVVVRIDDRGPYTDSRIIDLSRSAAKAIGMESISRVEIEGITQPR